MDIKRRILESGINWEDVPEPGGSYVSVNIRAGIAYVAIQFPIEKDNFLYTGRLGIDLTTEEGCKAARLCSVNVIKQINKYVGFNNIEGLNHIDFYYQSSDSWDEGPKVANGASDLFVEMLGTVGQHSRAILGVDNLPRNFSVGLTASFTIMR